MQDFNLWIIQQFVNGDSTKLDPQIANIMWIKNNAVFFFWHLKIAFWCHAGQQTAFLLNLNLALKRKLNFAEWSEHLNI